MTAEPRPREVVLAEIKELAAAEAEARAAHQRATLRLKAAVLANSGYVLRRDHPDHLSINELGEALDRHWSRPERWCQAMLADTDGVRTRATRLLGRDPVPDYGADRAVSS